LSQQYYLREEEERRIKRERGRREIEERRRERVRGDYDRFDETGRDG
jgi:hypothetical protein